MIEIVRSNGQANPPKVDYSPRPFEQASVIIDRQPAPVASPNYVRVLGSTAQDSRTPGSLRSGTWNIHWTSHTTKPPSAVLMSSGRVLAQGSDGWALFERDGKHVAQGLAGQAVITIDPNAGMFYTMGGGNFLQAMGLEKGDLRFKVPLGHNESVVWPLFHRSGKRIVAVGIERPMISPRGQQPPPRSLLQVIEIGSPLKMSPYKVLLSLELQQELIFSDARMLPVASGEILWTAFPNLLIRTSPAQNIDGAWSATFTPISASADEAGWLHMVVDPGNPNKGDRELWVVTPDGRRTLRAQIPPAYGESKVPPAIGYDHRIYLRSSRSVAAFSPQGTLLWESQTGAEIAGISVTPDGHAVVAAGPDILAFDSTGKQTHLATLPARVTTAPVVSAEGEILVGTEAGVACLSVR